jgi:excisionase family DNA binding protein
MPSMNGDRGQNSKTAKRLYSLGEAAAYLGRTVGAVREVIWAGKIPIVRFDRRIYLDIRDLERFIEQNKVVYPS